VECPLTIACPIIFLAYTAGLDNAQREIESRRDSEGLLAPMIDNYSGLLRQPSSMHFASH
jgi:hypothetical protein